MFFFKDRHNGKQFAVEEGLEFLCVCGKGAECCGIERARFFQIVKVVSDVPERDVETGKDFVGMGLMVAVKLECSHCICSLGAVVRGVSALARWHVPHSSTHITGSRCKKKKRKFENLHT